MARRPTPPRDRTHGQDDPLPRINLTFDVGLPEPEERPAATGPELAESGLSRNQIERGASILSQLVQVAGGRQALHSGGFIRPRRPAGAQETGPSEATRTERSRPTMDMSGYPVPENMPAGEERDIAARFVALAARRAGVPLIQNGADYVVPRRRQSPTYAGSLSGLQVTVAHEAATLNHHIEITLDHRLFMSEGMTQFHGQLEDMGRFSATEQAFILSRVFSVLAGRYARGEQAPAPAPAPAPDPENQEPTHVLGVKGRRLSFEEE